MNQIAERLRAQAESLLPQRESLNKKFGDHFAFVVSKLQSNPSEFDSIIAAWLDGQPAAIEENDAV